MNVLPVPLGISTLERIINLMYIDVHQTGPEKLIAIGPKWSFILSPKKIGSILRIQGNIGQSFKFPQGVENLKQNGCIYSWWLMTNDLCLSSKSTASQICIKNLSASSYDFFHLFSTIILLLYPFRSLHHAPRRHGLVEHLLLRIGSRAGAGDPTQQMHRDYTYKLLQKNKPQHTNTRTNLTSIDL